MNEKILLIEDIKLLLKASENNIKEKIINIQTHYNKLKKESVKKIVFSEKEILVITPNLF